MIVSKNSVMIASANEIHLAAFREHPEFPSFRGRMELIRTGYLLDYKAEEKIYDNQVAFRNDANLWNQVAELTFDVFMIRNRPKG